MKRHALTCLVLALFGLSCAAILEPVIEAQRETIEDMAELRAELQTAQETAAAIQAAFARGEITEAERDAEIEALRTTILDGLSSVHDGLKSTGDALANIKLEDLIAAGSKVAADTAPLLPEPWQTILTAAGILGAGWYGSRKAQQVNAERDQKRQLRGEPIAPVPSVWTPAPTPQPSTPLPTAPLPKDAPARR